jgi:hypothetical protein
MMSVKGMTVKDVAETMAGHVRETFWPLEIGFNQRPGSHA